MPPRNKKKTSRALAKKAQQRANKLGSHILSLLSKSVALYNSFADIASAVLLIVNSDMYARAWLDFRKSSKTRFHITFKKAPQWPLLNAHEMETLTRKKNFSEYTFKRLLAFRHQLTLLVQHKPKL